MFALFWVCLYVFICLSLLVYVVLGNCCWLLLVCGFVCYCVVFVVSLDLLVFVCFTLPFDLLWVRRGLLCFLYWCWQVFWLLLLSCVFGWCFSALLVIVVLIVFRLVCWFVLMISLLYLVVLFVVCCLMVCFLLDTLVSRFCLLGLCSAISLTLRYGCFD